jgi:beta-amylase
MRRAMSAVLATVMALSLAVGGAGTATAQPSGVPGPVALGNPKFTANVIAPLKVLDFEAFERDIKTEAAYGVDAVSVDVWWGIVEAQADNSFDWSYYDRIFDVITANGLEIAPILSFHQCGGNVGDDCQFLLPSWLWAKYADRSYKGIKLGLTGLQHRSEQGNYSPETVQGWADQVVENEYRDFTRAFAARYGQRYASDVVEINISLGPSGELRYPSYNSHDVGTGYPTRGGLQSYSPLAVADFQDTALRKYKNLRGVNAAWGTAFTSKSQIGPPADATAFFESGTYRNEPYGRDFVDWYNGSLVDHGKRMMETVIGALGRNFPKADIGYKVPGIHWTITNPAYPRATEVTTGLIQTSIDPDARATGHGYKRIIDLANQVNARGRTVVVHFTALEMNDMNEPPQYSLAKTLVGWFGQYAYDAGVPLKGENALQGGVYSDNGWDNINDAFDTWGYLGLTVLRSSDVSSGVGATRYAQFIDKYRS